MNHRKPPRLPAGMRKTVQCLSLLLVPLTLDEGQAGPRQRTLAWPGADPAPYLPVLGSASFRVAEPIPPPDLASHPAAGAPPLPPLTPVETDIAAANSTAVLPPHVVPAPSADRHQPVASPSPPAKVPAPILPDTVHPLVRPEDFLPYFQVPGVAHPPQPYGPAPLPPSSATYTQTPP